MNQSTSGVSPTHSPTLQDAWFKFGEYDKNATLAQKRFVYRHQLINTLGVGSTVLVVVHSLLPQSHPIAEVLAWLIIVIPISISVLTAIDVKFNLGLAWICRFLGRGFTELFCLGLRGNVVVII